MTGCMRGRTGSPVDAVGAGEASARAATVVLVRWLRVAASECTQAGVEGKKSGKRFREQEEKGWSASEGERDRGKEAAEKRLGRREERRGEGRREGEVYQRREEAGEEGLRKETSDSVMLLLII